MRKSKKSVILRNGAFLKQLSTDDLREYIYFINNYDRVEFLHFIRRASTIFIREGETGLIDYYYKSTDVDKRLRKDIYLLDQDRVIDNVDLNIWGDSPKNLFTVML